MNNEFAIQRCGRKVRCAADAGRIDKLEAERDRLLELVSKAHEIIYDNCPGHTAWLDAAEAELEDER